MAQEAKILEFIKSEYTWEQIIYDIIAWEGLDPWDIDICKLSDSFIKYMNEMKRFDFHIPSKFVIIAAMLLRMKSKYINYVTEEIEKAQKMEEEMIEEEINNALLESEGEILQIASIEIPPKRKPTRKVVLPELVMALKRALNAHERKESRRKMLRNKINVKSDEIAQRIASLYEKINAILGRMNRDEMMFSELVIKWERDNVVNTFVPIVYLDNQKKIEAVQNDLFEDIIIKKRYKGRVEGRKSTKAS
ncbi:MAG: segregation/condensation protein A [Candidatus Micrarchaeota archaeon]|nr:segregation/condensation protein A [Candidatus Micrarchaeota archaeon]